MLFPRFAFQSVSLRMLAVACLATGQILLGHQSLWGRPQETSASPVIRTPMTIAERSNYLATSRESDILEFLEKLTAEHPMAKLVDVGTTQENRPLWTLVISKEKANPLPLAKDDPRIVIVMIGGIHSGECDGKEALMALARDVLKGRNPDWLERCVLVFLPNFNADGNQRVGPMHRPGQEGPALGMGTRENALGQDLNRDFVKLDTLEVRSLVRMLDAWRADVLIDAHTTNGSLHRYDMTYGLPHNPAIDTDLAHWLRHDFMPGVETRMLKRDCPVFPYGNFNRDHTVWESYGFEPRYSTEYMALRGKIGILVESYSYASYQRRIEASYAFIEECIEGLSAQASKVKELVSKDIQEPPKGVFIQGKIEPSMEPTEYNVKLAVDAVGTLQVDAPHAYYIPEECSWLASRVRLHGIPMIEVSGQVDAKTQRYRIEARKDLSEFQFRKMAKYDVSLEENSEQLGPGWIVPTNNPLGRLTTYILEPHSEESLAMWGFLDPELRKDSIYPIRRLASIPNFSTKRELSNLKWKDLKASGIRGERLTMEKLFSSERKVGYNGMPSPLPKWMPHGESYLVRKENRWMHIDAISGAMHPWETPLKMVEALGKLTEFKDGVATPYGRQIDLFNESLEQALIEHKQDLYFYDLPSDQAIRLTESPDEKEELFELSPSRRHVAFVKGQNLWVIDCKSKELKQLTHDGGGEILCGKLDWVYQEEVYGRGQFKAYWWNPDGTKIAYLRLDETPVPNFVIDDAIPFAQRIENMRYPKAGQPNPKVELKVADITTGQIQDVPLSINDPEDRLVVRVGWKPGSEDQLVYQIQNRIQSKLDLVLYDLKNASSQTLVHEESDAWVDVIDVPRWLPDGSFVWLSDSQAGRRHLFHVGMDGTKRALSSGDWDVKEILSVSDSGKVIWFTGHRSAPTNTDVLRLSLESGAIEDMSGQVGSHRVSVHPTGSYYLDSWSDLSNPAQVWLKDREGKPIRLVSEYRSDRFDYVDTASPELIQIPARDGQKLQGLLYKPTNGFDTSKGSMPVVIYVYAGPSAPTVENSWIHRSDLWHRYLTDQGIAVMLCDNRSALGRGNSDTWKIYRDLGALELRDLEDTVAWLGTQSWADTKRLGIWGWSYGGYFTAYAMTHSKLFRAGIAGAPVTDWRNYDSIYTERYMSTPQLNPEGYKSSSVVEAAGNLHGRLMLIHGEIDDNVHMTNTLQLAYALQKSGKQFELMVYPKSRHGITDPQQVQHQFHMMTDFWIRNLLGEDSAE
ncbi:MAG: DPP IV N-terminal domain-containing protein [Planctomycetaceae bacterium]|nr:DPP IV N-terminal domain-containing protein [Planctomycetaceae bacterium]